VNNECRLYFRTYYLTSSRSTAAVIKSVLSFSLSDRPSRHRRVQEPFPQGRVHPAQEGRYRLLQADVALLVAAAHRHQLVPPDVPRHVAQRREHRTRSLDRSLDGELGSSEPGGGGRGSYAWRLKYPSLSAYCE
jgi:hypothetical protein